MDGTLKQGTGIPIYIYIYKRVSGISLLSILEGKKSQTKNHK
jgi:hypothetical protein